MPRRFVRFLFVLIAVAVVAFSAARVVAQPAPAFATWRIGEVPAELKPAVAHADEVIAAQHNMLLRQLNRALGDGGAGTAIQACHLEATDQTIWVARQKGFATGRTGDRLRMPTNAPRPWAAAVVSQYAGKQAADVAGFAVDLGDRVGVLRPIVMTALCQDCHGPADRIRPEVRKVLADQYPRDRAVGFRNGEIRGWYWAEVPKNVKK